MTIFIDIAGSWIVRASMITMMLGISVTMNDALYKTTQKANTDKTLAKVANTILTDLNMAGNNVTSPTNVFQPGYVSPTDMKFYGDLDNSGLYETIRYQATYNSTTKLYSLYRSVNRENSGIPLLLGKNFTSVKFTYFNYLGVPTTNYLEVMSVRVTLVTTIPGATAGGFTTAMNDFLVYPANL